MSSETAAARKKRASAENTPAPEGDHRKRRRNRTTQSCLNCHTSKRMCDRKRPACARCTQLGLTGLCVYEVDDPSQRSDAQDESSRLLKRVAELEGVIRELKNKPHPRWVQTAVTGEDIDKWQCRSHVPGTEHESCSSNASSPPASSSSSDRGDASQSPTTSFSPMIQLHTAADQQRKSNYRQHSPMDTPSPTLLTPTDEYPLGHVGIAGHSPISMPQDYDLTSMFLSYPNLMGCNDSFPGVDGRSDSSFGKNNGHCGCLGEQGSYTAMLELSLRLRKACSVLSRSPHHQLGSHCHLRQRLAELDSFTTNALSEVPTPGELNEALLAADRVYPGAMGSFQSRTSIPGNTTPNSTQGIRTWDMMTSNANSPAPLDDSFMTWEPPRRT